MSGKLWQAPRCQGICWDRQGIGSQVASGQEGLTPAHGACELPSCLCNRLSLAHSEGPHFPAARTSEPRAKPVSGERSWCCAGAAGRCPHAVTGPTKTAHGTARRPSHAQPFFGGSVCCVIPRFLFKVSSSGGLFGKPWRWRARLPFKHACDVFPVKRGGRRASTGLRDFQNPRWVRDSHSRTPGARG